MGTQNTIWRIVILSLMCYALLSLGSVQKDLKRTERIAEELEKEVSLLREENGQLQRLLAQGYDDSQMELLARQRLGLVMPGEIVFYFEK